MPETYKIFIGGGGDAWFSHIVETYEASYRKNNPAFHCSYFSWTNSRGVAAILDNASRGSDITIVGHSYGAGAAFSAVQVRPVQTLISIDPVGRIRPAWTTIRARCFIWLNVRAQPSAANRTFDDTISAIGGQYPLPPAAGQPGAPNYSLVANATHGAFSTMMNVSTPKGISGKSLLGGQGVG